MSTKLSYARPQRKTLWRYLKNDYQLYILLLPCLVLMIVFRYFPMQGVIMAFQDYSITNGIFGSEFVGFKHFIDMFSQDMFLRSLRNTLWIKFLGIIVGMPAPILLAIMINEIGLKRYRKTLQSITYFPYFLSWVVINGMLLNLLNVHDGIINQIIVFFGGEPTAFMMSSDHFVWVLIFSHIWKFLGSDTILYLAALTAIDPGLYEAARIDGAGKLQQIFHITLPGLMGTFVILQILAMGRILQAGDAQIISMYSEPVYEVADVIGTYVFRTGIGGMRYGYATAVGLFQSVVGLCMVLFTNQLSKKYADSSVW